MDLSPPSPVATIKTLEQVVHPLDLGKGNMPSSNEIKPYEITTEKVDLPDTREVESKKPSEENETKSLSKTINATVRKAARREGR